MRDFHWDEPNTEPIELTQEEVAELDRRIEQARNGSWYTMEEVREHFARLIAEWKSQRPQT